MTHFPLPRPPAPLPHALRSLCRVALAVTVLVACTSGTPLLNSERIEQKFGNYGVEVLAASDRERTTSLFTLQGEEKITRTLARVQFVDPGNRLFADEHALIVAGASIGATFKSRGWQISKRDIRLGSRLLTAADASIANLMRIDLPQTVALHEYVLVLSRGDRHADYARITEIHHPEYLGPADLRRIYE